MRKIIANEKVVCGQTAFFIFIHAALIKTQKAVTQSDMWGGKSILNDNHSCLCMMLYSTNDLRLLLYALSLNVFF